MEWRMSTYKSKWQLKGIVVGKEKPATKKQLSLIMSETIREHFAHTWEE